MFFSKWDSNVSIKLARSMEYLPIVTGVISSLPLEAVWKALHFQLILSLVDKFNKFCLVDFLLFDTKKQNKKTLNLSGSKEWITTSTLKKVPGKDKRSLQLLFWELLVANNSQLNEIYLRVSLVTLVSVSLESVLIHSLCKHSDTCFCQNNLTKLFCQIIDLYWNSSIDFWVTNNFTITIWELVITIAKMRGMFSCSYHLSTFFFFSSFFFPTTSIQVQTALSSSPIQLSSPLGLF